MIKRERASRDLEIARMQLRNATIYRIRKYGLSTVKIIERTHQNKTIRIQMHSDHSRSTGEER